MKLSVLIALIEYRYGWTRLVGGPWHHFMKTKTKKYLPLLAAIGLGFGIPNPLPMMLICEYQASDLTPDLMFNYYHSANFSIPTTNWPLLTNIWVTNLTLLGVTSNNMATLALPVKLSPGAHFYFMTSSNALGESDPSNLTFTNVPTKGQGLRLK